MGNFNTESVLWIFGSNYGGRSDLFSILLCSALSFLKVNAVHHWSHKALLDDLRREFVRDFFLILMNLKVLTEFFFDAGLNWLYLLSGEREKKKYLLFMWFSRYWPQKNWEQLLVWTSPLPSSSVLIEILETMSKSVLYSYLPPSGHMWKNWWSGNIWDKMSTPPSCSRLLQC